MSDQNDHHQDISFTSRGAQESQFYLRSGIDTLDSRRCLSMGLEQAMVQEYKSYFQKAFRLNRRLLGLKFAQAEAELDNQLDDKQLTLWLATINFLKADGDPHWQPSLDDYTIFQRVKMLEKWHKSISCLHYCYEWTKKGMLHVHLQFRWIANGAKDVILKRLKDAFRNYYNQDSDVDVKKCNKNMLWYLRKDGKVNTQQHNAKYRKKYHIEDLYPVEKVKSEKEKEKNVS